MSKMTLTLTLKVGTNLVLSRMTAPSKARYIEKKVTYRGDNGFDVFIFSHRKAWLSNVKFNI